MAGAASGAGCAGDAGGGEGLSGGGVVAASIGGGDAAGGGLLATSAGGLALGGGGGAAAGSVPPRSASELYRERAASAASESEVARCASGEVVPVGLSGIAARSGLVPSAFVGAVSGGNPFESAAGVVSGVSSPIRSEIVEQPAVQTAMVNIAARRTKVFVMPVYLSPVETLGPTVYRRAASVPSRSPCKSDEIL